MVSITASHTDATAPCSSAGLRQLLGKKRASPGIHDALTKSTSTSSFCTASTVATSLSEQSSSTFSLVSSISNPRMGRRAASNSAAADDDSSQRYFDDGWDESDASGRAQDDNADGAEEQEALSDAADDGTAATEHDDEITITSASSSESSSSLPCTAMHRKRVHFDETVAIGSIPQLDEYSPSELEAMYYSHVEEDNLRAEAKYVVKSIRMARLQEASGRPTPASARILHDDHHDDYCPRGLENYLRTKEEKRARKAEARDLICSVLLAQEEQWEAIHGTRDEDRDEARTILAVASVTRSRRSRATAIELALRDEEEVRQMIEMEERERRRQLEEEEEEEEEEQQQEQTEAQLQDDNNDTSDNDIIINNKPSRAKAGRRLSAAASTIASKVVRKASSSIIVNANPRRRKTTAAAAAAGTGTGASGSARAACA